MSSYIVLQVEAEENVAKTRQDSPASSKSIRRCLGSSFVAASGADGDALAASSRVWPESQWPTETDLDVA